LLPQDQLILTRHRARPGGTARQVALDIRDPRLGLSDPDYQALCSELSSIIHCAAITDMSGQTPELSATNIDGVRNVINLARAAGARLHFVSTAYCSQTYGPTGPVASDYVSSKRAAEALVRDSDLDWTIIRPSIIIGHSETGAIASFQGFHLFITTILKGRLPAIPLARETQCDFVPADWVAGGIARIVQSPEWGRTYWLTAGAVALTIDEMVQAGSPFAAQMGRDLSTVAFLRPDQIEAEIHPRLPARLRDRLNMLVSLSKVVSRQVPFPTDLAGIEPAQLKAALIANLNYWADHR
jgi:nucleoside-diphosphate-sugar epimerase